MKKSITAILFITLTACTGSLPQSASEMRQFTKTSALANAKSVTVSRGISSVRSVLKRMSSQCYNRTKSSSSVYRIGAYGPQSVTRTFKYTSTVRTQKNTTTMAVRIKQLGSKITALVAGSNDGYIGFVVDATPTAGGTKITVYGGSIGSKNSLQSVINSIKTGRIKCLDLV